jgi:hypothetical protein
MAYELKFPTDISYLAEEFGTQQVQSQNFNDHVKVARQHLATLQARDVGNMLGDPQGQLERLVGMRYNEQFPLHGELWPRFTGGLFVELVNTYQGPDKPRRRLPEIIAHTAMKAVTEQERFRRDDHCEVRVNLTTHLFNIGAFGPDGSGSGLHLAKVSVAGLISPPGKALQQPEILGVYWKEPFEAAGGLEASLPSLGLAGAADASALLGESVARH